MSQILGQLLVSLTSTKSQEASRSSSRLQARGRHKYLINIIIKFLCRNDC